MTMPLDRAADVLRRELHDYLSGWGDELRDHFTYKLASDVLGHAQLPEELDLATEQRTANLLAWHQVLLDLYDRAGEGVEVNVEARRQLIQETIEVRDLIQQRMGRA